MSHVAELDANELERRWHEHHGDEYPNIKNVIKVGHFVMAILSLIGAFGGTIASLVYVQADRNARMEKDITYLREDQQRQDTFTAYIRKRQEINEDTISILKQQAAVEDQRYVAMQSDHARIYSAIEGLRTPRK